jgi:hypothetical protein
MSDERTTKLQNQVLEHVEELRKRIGQTSVDEDTLFFRNLLWGILTALLRDYAHVTTGVKLVATDLTAWGTRNLLELRFITEFVLASNENAIAFRNDLMIDGKEFYEAVTKMTIVSHKQFVEGVEEIIATIPEKEETIKRAFEQGLQAQIAKGPQTKESKDAAAPFKEFLRENGLENKRPLKSSDIAAKLKAQEEFEPLFKICSKLMHRTAMSIALTVTKATVEELLPFLDSSAFSELLRTYDAIKRYFEANGLRLPS